VRVKQGRIINKNPAGLRRDSCFLLNFLDKSVTLTDASSR
jgi:hypothetical protein